MRTLLMKVERELFRFESFGQWVSTATARFAACGVHPNDYLAVDARGRRCVMGRDFMRARDDDAFPVVVYETYVHDADAASASPQYVFHGPIYNRPCGRGVCLGVELEDLDAAIPEGWHDATIIVRGAIPEPGPDAPGDTGEATDG